MNWRAICTLAMALALLGGCGGGAGPGPGPNDGTVTGRVIDWVTASPISGAAVRSGAISTSTAADGSYTLSGLPPGLVSITASASGYAATTVAVDCDTVNFALIPEPLSLPASVTVQVNCVDGIGFNGNASVRAVSRLTSASATVVLTNGAGSTDMSLPPGTYDFAASTPGKVTAIQTNVGVSGPRSVNLTLADLGPVNSGTITLSSGPPPGFSSLALSVGFDQTPTLLGGTGTSISSLPPAQYVATAVATSASEEIRVTKRSVSVTGGGTASLTVTWPPSLPSPISPIPGSTTGLTPTLSWQSVTGADLYLVTLEDITVLPTVLKWKAFTQGTSVDVPAEAGLAAGRSYRWRVEASDLNREYRPVFWDSDPYAALLAYQNWRAGAAPSNFFTAP